MSIKVFCFNPFYENTYIIYKKGGEAWIFDPGCSNSVEENEIVDFISINNLHLSRLLLTHAHIDHILGLDFVYKRFGLKAEMNILEEPILQSAAFIANIYGLNYYISPKNDLYISDNQIISVNNENVRCLLTPGHSPGSMCYYFEKSNFLIAGDLLFKGSIGRTDLPGGNFETLIESIKTKLYPLAEEVIIYPGHGESTTIGHEKLTNPFLIN